jgi:hypothetical protein
MKFWLLPVLVITLFALPILVYVWNIISDRFGGVQTVSRDTKIIKRNLSIVLGITWASLACGLVALIMGWDLSVIVASAVGVLAWGLALKLFLGYVQAV